MGDSDAELTALKGQIPAAAVNLLNGYGSQVTGAARDANSPSIVTGWLSTGGRVLNCDPEHGTVGAVSPPEMGFLRLDLSDGTHFSSLDVMPGSRRILQRFDDFRVDLVWAPLAPGTNWTLTPFSAGSSELRITTGDGNNALTVDEAGGVFTSPGGSPWIWSATPPPPPPRPDPSKVLVETFWWGFHFVVPESVVTVWNDIILTTGDVLDTISDATGPAAPFIDLIAGYLQTYYKVAVQVDRGNGLYVSMSWFAPGIFVPTPI
jgi:hypothetical protein